MSCLFWVRCFNWRSDLVVREPLQTVRSASVVAADHRNSGSKLADPRESGLGLFANTDNLKFRNNLAKGIEPLPVIAVSAWSAKNAKSERRFLTRIEPEFAGA